MSLQGTLALYNNLERKTEDLLSLDRQVSALRREREELRTLMGLFREGLSQPRLWMHSGGVFLRTERAGAFQISMQRLDAVLRQLKQAEKELLVLAHDLSEHSALGTVAGEPEVLSVLSEVLEEES